VAELNPAAEQMQSKKTAKNGVDLTQQGKQNRLTLRLGLMAAEQSGHRKNASILLPQKT
jgi:hypothetical protein